MKEEKYLLDTHSLFFWIIKEEISFDFIDFLDRQSKNGKVLISSVSFWEIALLKKRGRIDIEDIYRWTDDILSYSPAKIIEPTISDMIDSTLLPDYHKDPFDRLLVAQAKNNHAILVTRDRLIPRYSIGTLWM
ncbi:MAG: type II toxin-antitoxin system VapC family toxin [Candidatus Aminicenantes bacterium]|nr:type II toxin-antitoxin system VapC family toxin [Candidatus Aminicenantes bacterium]